MGLISRYGGSTKTMLADTFPQLFQYAIGASLISNSLFHPNQKTFRARELLGWPRKPTRILELLCEQVGLRSPFCKKLDQASRYTAGIKGRFLKAFLWICLVAHSNVHKGTKLVDKYDNVYLMLVDSFPEQKEKSKCMMVEVETRFNSASFFSTFTRTGLYPIDRTQRRKSQEQHQKRSQG